MCYDVAVRIMFRIIELGDGSHVVCDTKTGRQLSIVPATQTSHTNNNIVNSTANHSIHNHRALFTSKKDTSNKYKPQKLTKDTLCKFDIASYMGITTLNALPHVKIDPQEAFFESLGRIADHCSVKPPISPPFNPDFFHNYSLLSKIHPPLYQPVNHNSFNNHNNKISSSNLTNNNMRPTTKPNHNYKIATRSNTSQNGHSNSTGHYHIYCFTKREKKERYLQLLTGLNKRSRKLQSKCKKLSIDLERLVECPICKVFIGSSKFHGCNYSVPTVEEEQAESSE